MPAIPRPEAELARPRARKGGNPQSTVIGTRRGAVQPLSDPAWHRIALMLWDALGDSGQADFYEASDWAVAYALCDDLSEYKRATWKDGNPKRSPEMLKALQAGMTSLLMTEGDRRRVHMELVAPPEEKPAAAVLAIADYQAALGEPANGPEEDDDPED